MTEKKVTTNIRAPNTLYVLLEGDVFTHLTASDDVGYVVTNEEQPALVGVYELQNLLNVTQVEKEEVEDA